MRASLSGRATAVNSPRVGPNSTRMGRWTYLQHMFSRLLCRPAARLGWRDCGQKEGERGALRSLPSWKRGSFMKRLIVVVTAALLLATTASAAAPMIGKVRGAFVRSAYDGTLDSAGLKRYIKTPSQYVWCAWQ